MTLRLWQTVHARSLHTGLLSGLLAPVPLQSILCTDLEGFLLENPPMVLTAALIILITLMEPLTTSTHHAPSLPVQSSGYKGLHVGWLQS